MNEDKKKELEKIETQEWVDSLNYVLETQGEETCKRTSKKSYNYMHRVWESERNLLQTHLT